MKQAQLFFENAWLHDLLTIYICDVNTSCLCLTVLKSYKVDSIQRNATFSQSGMDHPVCGAAPHSFASSAFILISWII